MSTYINEQMNIRGYEHLLGQFFIEGDFESSCIYSGVLAFLRLWLNEIKNSFITWWNMLGTFLPVSSASPSIMSWSGGLTRSLDFVVPFAGANDMSTSSDDRWDIDVGPVDDIFDGEIVALTTYNNRLVRYERHQSNYTKEEIIDLWLSHNFRWLIVFLSEINKVTRVFSLQCNSFTQKRTWVIWIIFYMQLAMAL